MKSKIFPLFTILLILIIIWGFFYGLGFLLENKGKKQNTTAPISSLKAGVISEQSSSTEEFSIISGASYPQLTKAYFTPGEVTTGDNLVFSVRAEDPSGIKNISAGIKTDLKDETVDLKLVEGDNKNGTWQGQWHVCCFNKEDYYPVVFKAQSSDNKEKVVTIFIRNSSYKLIKP